jgi:hypothetical protein
MFRRIVVVLSLPLIWGCLPKRQSADSGALGLDPSRLKTEGLAAISWPCAGTGKEFPPGLNSQEEYCEWTRKPESFVGQGDKASTGDAGDINLPKACVFTNSFDQTRKFYLTKNTVGRRVDGSNPFKETFANSYAFLVGGTEPDSGSLRKGIIGHCITGNGCTAPNCVPTRASDPQICRALNQLGDKGCKVDVSFEVAPVITSGTVPAKRHGDRIVKPQLLVRNTIGDHCWYAVDPAIKPGLKNDKGQMFKASEQKTLVVCNAEALKVNNCDLLANDITVVATLKLASLQCVGGPAGPVPTPPVPTPTPTPTPDPVTPEPTPTPPARGPSFLQIADSECSLGCSEGWCEPTI